MATPQKRHREIASPVDKFAVQAKVQKKQWPDEGAFGYFAPTTSPFRLQLCLLLLTFGVGSLSDQESATDAFANGVKLLLSEQIDSLPIDNIGVIRAVQLDLEGWQFFNEHEKKSTTDGSLPLKRFRPITQSDILQVADDHWVFLSAPRSMSPSTSNNLLYALIRFILIALLVTYFECFIPWFAQNAVGHPLDDQ